MKIVIITIMLTLLFFTGCTFSEVQYSDSREDKIEKSEKKYKNINKDDLLHAFKKVFILTRKGGFIIDSYRDGLNVIKVNEVNKFFPIRVETDNYKFKMIKEDNNDVKVELSISRSFGVDGENKKYITKNSSVHKLIWDRVDYLIGLNKTWKGCSSFDITNSFLCESSEDVTQKDVINLEKNDKLKLKPNKNEKEIIKIKLVNVDLKHSQDENDFINHVNESVIPPANYSIIVHKSEDYELQSNEIINVE